MPVDPYPFTVTADDGKGTVATSTNTAGQTFDPIFAANPASRPTLKLDILGKHNIKVHGKGATGKTYQILASASMTNPSWFPLGRASADGNGRFSFLDPNDNDPSVRFYRALYVPR